MRGGGEKRRVKTANDVGDRESKGGKRKNEERKRKGEHEPNNEQESILKRSNGDENDANEMKRQSVVFH